MLIKLPESKPSTNDFCKLESKFAIEDGLLDDGDSSFV